MATKTTSRSRKPQPCAAAHQGCNCMGNTMLHNLNYIAYLKARQAAAPQSECPNCGESGNAAIIASLGQCFACKKAEDGVKYGIPSWTKR